MKTKSLLAGMLLTASSTLALADVVVPMHLTSNNQDIGSITIKESPKGLMFTPHLTGLPPGLHGFHVHENNSCDHEGDAAGGHLDPAHTGKHLGPFSQYGHLGDLPVLKVASDGSATHAVVAPRLKIENVLGHSLMIHAGGDNYSDQPEKLGGGGKRIACGSIPKKED